MTELDPTLYTEEALEANFEYVYLRIKAELPHVNGVLLQEMGRTAFLLHEIRQKE